MDILKLCAHLHMCMCDMSMCMWVCLGVFMYARTHMHCVYARMCAFVYVHVLL